MNKDSVLEWSVDDVASWLRQEKFASYAQTFIRYGIDGPALCDLQKERFDSLIRSSMGREDRASVLWKNINIIRRAKSKNASNFNLKNTRKVPPQTLAPPEPPQRDYRTDDFHQGQGVEEDAYEVFQEDQSAENIEEDFESDNEEDIDTFTDDDEIDSDNGEYLEPTDERGPPQIPSRPGQNLNASWGHSSTPKLSELQKGLMRRMSERAVRNIPQGPQEQRRNTMPTSHDHEQELYLTPAEEEDTYDVPENDAHPDEIYDIPDEPTNSAPTPAARQPPKSQQQSRHVMKPPGPRVPPGMPQLPKPRPHHHSNEPQAPPIPSRVQPRPITPEEDQEYAFPDGEPQDYIDPEGESGDENYLEPELQSQSRHVHQNIQSRRLPTVPQANGPPPPRPEKPNPLPAPADTPPAIPSRPQAERRKPNLENVSHISKIMPDFPNGAETTRPEPSRSPPRSHSRIPTIPFPNDNENENGNSTSDTTSRHVKNMRHRFEDNNNTDNARKVTPPPMNKGRLKPTDRQFPPPPPSPTHTPSPVIQRPLPSGGNSTPRKPGMPSSTSSTASVSSMSSSGSTSSESGPTARQRKPIQEPASWASEMPPLPQSNRRPSQPQLPNQSSIHQINERLNAPQQSKPAPSVSRAPPSPSRAPPVQPSAQPTKINELDGYPWYNGDIGRKESDKILLQCKVDGAFIVRNSSRGDASNPYSLGLWFNGRARNLQIRLRDDQKYALGTKKENEQAFDTPAQLIEHHMSNSLILAQDEGKVLLKVAAPVYR